MSASAATSVEDLVGDDAERRRAIVDVLVDAFDALIEADPRAFRRKFRKMAADPFAFYRGSACLFYADVVRLEDRWVDERTSRVWIQGDLHAENYGTYMDAEGVLVFDVNDFDEAFVGHFTWDLQRMAASLALMGYAKALSDRAIRAMITTYATAYLDQVRVFASTGGDSEYRLTLATTDGAVHAALEEARLQSRLRLLDRITAIEHGDRRFVDGSGVRRLDDDERAEVCAAFSRYRDTIPAGKQQESISYEIKDVVGRKGFGIGSAGLPAYNLLIEGRSQALENDVVLSMKQGNVAAPSRAVRDERVTSTFAHHGHRTVLSQRALQAHADPWLGWCELRGVGQVVAELSPYVTDLDWDAVSEPDEILPLLGYLGRATAKVHCVSDESSEATLVPFAVEEAIVAVVGDETEAFVEDLADLGQAYGALARDDHRRFVDAFRNGQIPGLPVD
jgi:uncharacterized protein (DUF2252 family)